MPISNFVCCQLEFLVTRAIRKMLYLLCLTSFIGLSSSWKCVYESCPDVNQTKLNVHVVAHTHNDVGWLQTVDQYFRGDEPAQGVYQGGVQHILSSVIEELLKDKKKKFTYVETAFFWKWFIRQSLTMQERVRMLVQQGRLQFAGGAWSMNDEATTHYQSIIDQFTFGIRKLNATFGPCGIPTVGWQIDPFGHSREFASLLAAMGYDGLFLGRIDYQDKENRGRDKTMEMLWRGDDDLGQRSDIFTSVLFNLYHPPPALCFGKRCRVSQRKLGESKVHDFISWIHHQASHYVTNNVLLTIGGDFAFQDAAVWFDTIDYLIEITNNMSAKEKLDINVFYSTPSCYLKAVKSAEPTLPIKQDDFFPYASEQHAYWTGFYSSRPSLKYFVRQGNTIFQMARQLQVLADLGESEANELILDNFAAAMGVMQHHDAITGTSKQHVANDYVKTLSEAIDGSLSIFNQAYHKLSHGMFPEPVLKFELCALNESSCDVSENTYQFVVNIFNPLAWQRLHILRIPVGNKENFSVRNSLGEIINSTVQHVFKGFRKPTHKVRVPEYELVFAVRLQALGYSSYYISENTAEKQFNDTSCHPYTRKNIPYKVDDTGHTGHLSHGYQQQHGIKYYPAFGSNKLTHKEKTRPSGAYIFHTKSLKSTRLKLRKSTVRENLFAKEQLIILDKKVAYILRTNKKPYLPYDELEWRIGPIDVSDLVGKEFVITHKVGIKNNATFYTDSNSRQMIKRIIDKRPQWNVSLTDPVSGNYYPVTNEITIENNAVRYIVMTDRSCGGTSINEGEIEILAHRRLLHDDGQGVDEVLNEIENEYGIVVRGTHKFLLVPTEYRTIDDAAAVRRMEIESLYDPVVLFADADDLDYDNWLKMNNRYTGIKTLQVGVNLLTLAPWRENVLLLRLENMLSKEIALPKKDLVRTVDLSTLFRDLQIISVKETLLAVNGFIEDHEGWEWKTKNPFSYSFNKEYSDDINTNPGSPDTVKSKRNSGHVIYLSPKQIRTFLIEYKVDIR